WDLSPDRTLALWDSQRLTELRADIVILALGAIERALPVPGWTLPGVLTPGAAQNLLKSQGVAPGRRALVAGSGPFLLVVAVQLAAAGVEVVAVLEAAPGRLRDFMPLLGHPEILRQGLARLRALRRRGVPVHWGSVVRQIEGRESVEHALATRVD